jgi:hypothetical protein
MNSILTALIAAVVSSTAFATQPMQALLTQNIDQRVKAFRELKGEGGYEFLAHTAFDKRNGLQTRWRAITTMGRLDPDGFRKELNRALMSGEWYMRDAALIALQTDERPRAVAWSMKLLDDPALMVRTQAVRNLIQLNAREAEGKLWDAIFSAKNFRGHQSLWVRAHMAEALAGFSGPGRIKKFQRLLMDEDERLYKWAITGLEAAAGYKLGDKTDPIEVRRQTWLAHLGVEQI